MSIMKYLNEWMSMKDIELNYPKFLEHYRYNGRHVRFGFFCVEDVEPFK